MIGDGYDLTDEEINEVYDFILKKFPKENDKVEEKR